MSSAIAIREIGPDDFARAWPIFRDVVATGDTYSYPPDIDEARARARKQPARHVGDRLKRVFFKNALYEVVAQRV